MKAIQELPVQDVGKAKKNGVLRAQMRRRRPHSGAALPTIELYQAESCPFSHAVRNRLTELGMDFVAHSIPADNPLKHQQLVQAAGRDQIPFLVDHKTGVKLHKADQILTYLEREYGQPAPSFVTRIARDIERVVRASADRFTWRVRMPLERAESLRLDLNEGWQSVRGSIRVFRSKFSRALKNTKKRDDTAFTSPENKEII